MVDKLEDVMSREAFWQENPLLEYFPELKPLHDGQGERVRIQIRGKPYDISAHKYLDDEKWPHKDSYRMAFGIWEPNGDLIACADYKISKKGYAVCDDRYYSLPDELESSGSIGSHLYGFLVHEDFRDKDAGNTLLAVSLLVLESRKVKGVEFVSDATRSDCAGVEYSPQWASNHEKPEILEARRYSSFYTKYAGTKVDMPEKHTLVGTRVSAMQISLVENALGHYTPPMC